MSKLSALRHQPKTRDVCERLTVMAQALGPETKLPTVAQLCAELKVSRDTLNNALGELERQDVVRRVQGSGIFVSPNLSQKTIALVYAVTEPMHSPFWEMLVEGVRQRTDAKQERYRLYLGARGYNGSALPAELVEAIEAERIHGLIFIGQPELKLLTWLEKRNFPAVFFATLQGKHRVETCFHALSSAGVSYLAKQGCSRIGLWMPYGLWQRNLVSRGMSKLLAGFEESLRRYDLPFEPQWSWRFGDWTEQTCTESRQEQGYTAVREVFGKQLTSGKSKLDSGDLPDGVIITDDLMTRGVLVTLQRMGVRVGHDIKIVTHANRGSTMLYGYEDLVALMEYDPAAIVTEITSLLALLMQSHAPEQPIRLIQPVLKEHGVEISI